jgi:hypothetical protein
MYGRLPTYIAQRETLDISRARRTTNKRSELQYATSILTVNGPGPHLVRNYPLDNKAVTLEPITFVPSRQRTDDRMDHWHLHQELGFLFVDNTTVAPLTVLISYHCFVPTFKSPLNHAGKNNTVLHFRMI